MNTDGLKTKDINFYQEALNEAKTSLAEGGIPIGAVLAHGGNIIGRGHNQRVQKGSSILHGETDCIENAGRQLGSTYRESTLYTTLSPCSMCAGTILLYKIPRVVIGENTNFRGDEELLQSRGVTLINLNDPETIKIMRDFIAHNQALWHEDISCLKTD
jgi:cytosine deaminase